MRNGPNMYQNVDTNPLIHPGMGFPVRTKGTGNTEHMFCQWGLVGTGNREEGTSHETPRRAAGGYNFFLGGGNP